MRGGASFFWGTQNISDDLQLQHPGPGSVRDREHGMLLGVKTWLYIRDCVSLCLSDETLKAVGPFYLVSMPGEVKVPTQGLNV